MGFWRLWVTEPETLKLCVLSFDCSGSPREHLRWNTQPGAVHALGRRLIQQRGLHTWSKLTSGNQRIVTASALHESGSESGRP